MLDISKIQRPPELSSDKLRLIPLSLEAAGGLLTLFRDKEVQRYGYRTPPQELAPIQSWIQEQAGSSHAVRWTIHLPGADNDFIGLLVLKEIDHHIQRGEVGYSLLTHAWGQGYATECLNLLIPYAFNEIGLHELEGQVMPGNDASIRVLEKHGFKQSALLKQEYEGEVYELWQYLLRGKKTCKPHEFRKFSKFKH